MKALSQTIILTLTLVTASVAGAAVYKYIDEDGNVAYGDKPVDGAEKIKIQQPVKTPSYSESEDEASDSADNTEADGKPVAYKSLELLTPKPGKVIDERTGSVQIIFLPTPNLGRNDKLVISIDGKDVSKGRDANVSLRNVQAGTHKVVGRILDEDGKTKIKSDLVTFEVGKP